MQVLVVFLLTALTVWFLPRTNRSAVMVDVGKPWPYARLIAPYDFYIFKTEAELQKERDSLLQTFSPYFELNQQVADNQVAAFRQSFRNQRSEEMDVRYREHVEQRLREIYQRGIIDINDLQVLQLQNTTSVIIYHGTEASLTPIAQLFTERSAYEYFFDGLEQKHLSKQHLQKLNLNVFVKSNLIYDEEKSNMQKDDIERSLSPSSGMVQAGQNIIDRGDIVTPEIHQILESYNRKLAERSLSSKEEYMMLLGQVLYVLVIYCCLTLYFDLFRRDYVNSIRSVLLLVVMIPVFPIVSSLLVSYQILSVYLIPFAMLPIFLRIFMDSRTAFFVHAITILLCALSLRSPFEFVATQLVAGLIAIYSLRELSERTQIIRTSIFVTLSALIIYASLDLNHGRSFFIDDPIKRIDTEIYVHILISGLLLLFTYPLMPLLERVFGFISNVTLVELSNVNRDLLRQLSETAPGTFQHSMQVANLAAEVANKIGAKAQLVRTGALYHDIGKMNAPEFFTENQLGGNNPHKGLSNKESAAIILRHVTDGEEMADRNRLPRIIRDFISTHHGRGLAKYFYINEKNAHPDEPIDMEDYTYQGSNPSTIEQAILMMTDAVEASARSLKEYTAESIGELVDRIVDGQVADGFFKKCPITFQDIDTTKEVLKEKLRTIYHTRVSYPTLNKQLPA